VVQWCSYCRNDCHVGHNVNNYTTFIIINNALELF
jgi:hypothetical protein